MARWTVCLEPDCPEFTQRSRCEEHERAKDRSRGTRQARGYDAAYDAERRRLQSEMDRGAVFWCWRCPELGRPAHKVDPHDWHLGHAVGDRGTLRGPQCPPSNHPSAAPRSTP